MNEDRIETEMKKKEIKAYDDEEAEDGDVGNTEDVGINNRPLAVDSQ